MLILKDLEKLNKVSGIYKIFDSNDCYVGSAINLKRRLMSHNKVLSYGKHHNFNLQNLFNQNVKLNYEILELCDIDKLINREQYYIDILNPKYNICKIAGSAIGRKHSDETKRKISESLKGHVGWMKNRKQTEEAKIKCSIGNKGKVRSKKVKEKLSKRAKQFWKDNPDFNTKVNKEKLFELLSKGFKVHEIAIYFGVHRTTITNWKHKLNLI